MKKAVFMLLVLLFHGFGSAFSQEDSEVTKSYISENSKSILFGIDKDLYIDSFIGSAFSGKKHISSESAIRAGCSLSLNYQDRRSGNSTSSIDIYDYKNVSQDYAVTLSVEYLRYSNTNSRVYFFWGLGPQLSFRWGKTKYYEDEYSDWTRQKESQSTDWSIGVHSIVGIECFIASNISLSAEYGLTLYYENDKYESQYEEGKKYISKEQYARLQSSSKKLGLSIYF